MSLRVRLMATRLELKDFGGLLTEQRSGSDGRLWGSKALPKGSRYHMQVPATASALRRGDQS
jgi:hypothetical protein